MNLDERRAQLRKKVEHVFPEFRGETKLIDKLVEFLLSHEGSLIEVITTLQGKLTSGNSKNEALIAKLEELQRRFLDLKEEVEKLSQPPNGFASFVKKNEDGTVDVMSAGRKLRVNAGNEVDVDELQKGQEVILNETMNIVAVREYETRGEVVTLKEVLDSERAIVTTHLDEEQVVTVARPLIGVKLRPGDKLLYDPRSGYIIEVLPKQEMSSLLLEEVPDISYSDIGGLANQIDAIRDAVELPFLHTELFYEHQLKPPKGILLYGPPGCGKTLIAKAVANSLAKKVAEKIGTDKAKSYFINIKGPSLLNKYVGETERQIREIFQTAREKSEEGFPVIIFFDEMDSLFRTRGSGISSDVENTIVPQLLSEIDGVEALSNVIVIGASNREEMIDPAILRPGRLDVKIKIERPDKDASRQIFAIYLTEDLPIGESEIKVAGSKKDAIRSMIDRTVANMYTESDENRFLEVTYANGDKEVLYLSDFSSGAMIENIIARAKKEAIKRFLLTKEKGITAGDLIHAVREEFTENQELPNTTSPDDWARVSGKKGERIVYVRTLFKDGAGGKTKSIETIAPGQYL